MQGTGATWQEIADALGYRSRQAAFQAVSRLLDRTPAESVEQARAKHDAALQLLQRNSSPATCTRCRLATTTRRWSKAEKSEPPSPSARRWPVSTRRSVSRST